jgi:hypothetical protein
MKRYRVLWVLVIGSGISWAGLGLDAQSAPTVSGRPARAGEWGYRPADGERVSLTPPTFCWVHEEGAKTYDVQWSTVADFGSVMSVEGVPWNTYTHHTPFEPGVWHWRYRFADATGRRSDWSQTRRVVVVDDAAPFPMPTVEQQRERLPSDRPRLFLRPEDLTRLRAWASGDGASRFEALRAEADRVMAAGPTPEPERMGSARDKENAELVRYWWPNRVQTVKACEEAEVLAFVYLLTGEARYGEAARRWISRLATWDPDGPTNFELNCEAAKPLLHRLPRAYDWAWDALSEADRVAVRRVMERRLADAWESWEVQRGVGHLNRPYGSHANRTWHKLAEAGIAFLGELPEAATYLDYAVNKFYASYPVWSDEDGGWHEGVHYWAGYLGKTVWWLQVAEKGLGIDGLRKPFFAHVGDFPLYLAPPGSPNMGFGDLAFGRPGAGWGGFLEYFVRAKSAQPDGGRAAYWRWWMEAWNMREQDGILGFLYAATLPALPSARAPDDLPSSKVFRGIGVASLHTSLLDSRDDVHLLFKASPFGRQSHGHNPHNSFQLNAYGAALLTTCVYRDLHGSRFHYEWAHSTRAHNAVLVNGEDQVRHTPAPQGRIVDFERGAAADYVAGEAAEAYGGRLQRYQRHLLLVKEPDPMVVIWDDLEAVEPATFQFMLHAFVPFEPDETAARWVVTQPGAGAVIRYLSPVELGYRQWDGYDPAPSREFPNQWHLEAGTAQAMRELSMVTLIVPYRAGRTPEVRAVRLDGPTAVGLRVTVDGRERAMGFRKPGVQGVAQVRGQKFDGPWAVW